MRLLLERIEEADDRVAAQPEDHLDAEALEVLGEQIGRDARLGRGLDAASRPLAWLCS